MSETKMMTSGRAASTRRRSSPARKPSRSTLEGRKARSAVSDFTWPVKRNSSAGPSRFAYMAVESDSSTMHRMAAAIRSL